MKIIKIIKIIILLLIISNSNNLSAEIETSIQERINSAELIIVGDFMSHYQQFELTYSKKNRDTKAQNYICEVYTFSINEVLKGTFKDKTIEVKLVDECERTANNSSSPNDREIIENDEDENGQAILFLKKDPSQSYYYSPHGIDSLLIVHGTIEVITGSGYGLVFINNKELKKDIMTLNDLKTMINKGSNNAK